MKQMKKVIIGVVAFLVVCTIASARTFDSKGFRFSVAGDKQEIESSEKISGTIFLRSEYSNNQYDGELAFSLIKHGLFGDSLVDRQQKSTKGSTVRTAEFAKCSNIYRLLSAYAAALFRDIRNPEKGPDFVHQTGCSV